MFRALIHSRAPEQHKALGRNGRGGELSFSPWSSSVPGPEGGKPFPQGHISPAAGPKAWLCTQQGFVPQSRSAGLAGLSPHTALPSTHISRFVPGQDHSQDGRAAAGGHASIAALWEPKGQGRVRAGLGSPSSPKHCRHSTALGSPSISTRAPMLLPLAQGGSLIQQCQQQHQALGTALGEIFQSAQINNQDTNTELIFCAQ